MKNLKEIASRFAIEGIVDEAGPLGNGLINDSYMVRTVGDSPDYIMQRINHAIFRDVDLLQDNIAKVTAHQRRKLEQAGGRDIERRVLRFLPTLDGKPYYFDGENYWRIMVFISPSATKEAVTPETSREAGLAFGNFQKTLADIPDRLGETIPDFHNMEFRLKQFRDAIEADAAGRLDGVGDLVEELLSRADGMCRAERLHREGKLPKRVSHCDTKVNNILFDTDGSILCVIDLDTVMPSYVFSDYGDFLRSAANTGAEDDPNLDNVEFDMDIFRAFTGGYLESAGEFLTPVEIENLPYGAAMFPYMQAVRFLTDYLNGDTYYKTKYPEHNLVRTRAQFKLLRSIEGKMEQMKKFIEEIRK
jgi:Ser/Thr protein kinase RdoA (MazF antagonist)